MAKKKERKKVKHPEWEKLGFAGLILKAMTKAGKKDKKKKDDHLIEKDYW